MEISQHKTWITDFYQKRGWLQLSSSRRLNFLVEEVGELSQAIRKYEIGRDHPGDEVTTTQQDHDHIIEELADVLDEVLILCEKYNIDMDELTKHSETKLVNRFVTD
ncbi:MazG nucleotide pyrophosphohydrolase domain-containing protein [Leuconostoc fallax]|uniref:NTP pyrophosphohydrolase MazG-like domain-containing protein n=1 Tax=Leuconostoc fallax TaxID=1251 RepID=A0A4R5NAB5_9LACO|nr:MazG-like family protein [Leuconostoc fallax]MBU7456419.1 MazG-like family protein [Leuconostoc fallax]TDG69420.1 hypothetical protein C5L23_000882 [Leuconostoc fallax]